MLRFYFYISYTTCMIYFAHRGASKQAPANSKEAFALARKQGASCYELDVHLTRDGRLPVQHDYTVGNTEHRVQEFTWPQLQAFCAENGIACPALLEDVLPVVRPELACLNVELKNDDNVYPGIEKALLDLLHTCAADLLPKILFSSFDVSTLQRLRTLAAQANIGLLTRAFDPEQARALNARSVHINQTRVTAQMVQACHAENRKVFVYTVNTLAAAQQLEQMGVDGIFTDVPELFLK